MHRPNGPPLRIARTRQSAACRVFLQTPSFLQKHDLSAAMIQFVPEILYDGENSHKNTCGSMFWSVGMLVHATDRKSMKKKKKISS